MTRFARRRETKTARRGFTLVELLVSMVAGLIVAMSVVAMSAQATNTFHEESRIAGAEMQIRTAIDRLRADVGRASFMSTGNIWIDPNIYNATPGQTTNVSATNVAYNGTATGMSLSSLAGIRLWSGGSVAGANGATLSTVNNLSPDMIDLAGDMTGVEVLPIGGAANGKPAIEKVGCGGNGWRIHLNYNSSPALWRLVGLSATGTTHSYGQQLANAFQPWAPPSGSSLSPSSYLVRIYDNSTHKAQYYATCATTVACPTDSTVVGAACWNPGVGGVPDPYVDLDALSSATFNPSTLSGGSIQPNATINPIQIVRWQIQASLVNPPTDAGSAGKYDLTRWFLDAYGATAGNPEVIAEYAVDLKFAFTLDNTTDTTGDYVLPPSEPQIVYSFEDPTNAAIAGNVTTQPSVPLTTNGPQPQRIRSVRIRLATRTAMVDRDQPLTVAGSQTDYVYRYCTVNSAPICAASGNPVFARTRTLITEVSLPNQANMWYR